MFYPLEGTSDPSTDIAQLAAASQPTAVRNIEREREPINFPFTVGRSVGAGRGKLVPGRLIHPSAVLTLSLSACDPLRGVQMQKKDTYTRTSQHETQLIGRAFPAGTSNPPDWETLRATAHQTESSLPLPKLNAMPHFNGSCLRKCSQQKHKTTAQRNVSREALMTSQRLLSHCASCVLWAGLLKSFAATKKHIRKHSSK